MGITEDDLVIAAVGAGLRAFTRYKTVEYANGDEVPAERFLSEVEGVVLETVLERLFDVPGARVSAVDAPSRFYVLWRYTYGRTELDAGEAIVFAYAQGIELDGPGGLTQGARALLKKKKSKYVAYDYTERGDDVKLGLSSEEGEPAPLIDILHRVLWLMENRPRSLPAFLDEARPDGERMRLIAKTLAGPALRGSLDADSKTFLETTSAEQSALGKLLANWRSLVDGRLEDFRLR
jgi:putative DNA methylase